MMENGWARRSRSETEGRAARDLIVVVPSLVGLIFELLVREVELSALGLRLAVLHHPLGTAR